MYLLMLVWAFDSQPLELFDDQGAAEVRAREVLSAYDPAAAIPGRPARGHGELGPPGLVSGIIGIVLIPFVGGKPADEGRSYFVPEVPAKKEPASEIVSDLPRAHVPPAASERTKKAGSKGAAS